MKTSNFTSNLSLPFQIDPTPATDTLTAFGGLPLVAGGWRLAAGGTDLSVARYAAECDPTSPSQTTEAGF
jgi:hypothetical protein